MSSLPIRVVLVPAGAEYRAVRRGLSRADNPPKAIAIPAGPQGVRRFLQTQPARSLLQSGNLLLMGLGGSLAPQCSVGEAVVLGQVWERASGQQWHCDPSLTEQIAAQLGAKPGTGVSCDRVITTAKEKKQLGNRYGADIVDMEAAALLEYFSLEHFLLEHFSLAESNTQETTFPKPKIAIVRVISDDCQHDLPDISQAISADGSLKPLVLALSFVRRPRAAVRLIGGSLKGLKALEHLASVLFEQ